MKEEMVRKLLEYPKRLHFKIDHNKPLTPWIIEAMEEKHHREKEPVQQLEKKFDDNLK